MATTNGSNTQKFSNQFQYTGDGPLDIKQAPVSDVASLPSKIKAYEGQTVTVLSDDEGLTSDYIYTNGEWKKKNQIIDCGIF